jgi:ubiquitin C-terminal hydrolase
MMQVESTTCLMKDMHGNTGYCVFADKLYDVVCVCGLFDQSGDPIKFESEAYHLDDWCFIHDIELRKIEEENGFDYLWDVAKNLEQRLTQKK